MWGLGLVKVIKASFIRATSCASIIVDPSFSLSPEKTQNKPIINTCSLPSLFIRLKHCHIQLYSPAKDHLNLINWQRVPL